MLVGHNFAVRFSIESAKVLDTLFRQQALQRQAGINANRMQRVLGHYAHLHQLVPVAQQHGATFGAEVTRRPLVTQPQRKKSSLLSDIERVALARGFY